MCRVAVFSGTGAEASCAGRVRVGKQGLAGFAIHMNGLEAFCFALREDAGGDLQFDCLSDGDRAASASSRLEAILVGYKQRQLVEIRIAGCRRGLRCIEKAEIPDLAFGVNDGAEQNFTLDVVLAVRRWIEMNRERKKYGRRDIRPGMKDGDGSVRILV